MHETTTNSCSVRGVRLYEMRHAEDVQRGHLAAMEFERDLPFTPKRCFITFQIPPEQVRGQHAHKECEQLLVCVSGHCDVAVDDGNRCERFRLDRPTMGVYVPPLVWASEFHHSPDSALMVFASHPYEPEDYIREYDEFLALTASSKAIEALPP